MGFIDKQQLKLYISNTKNILNINKGRNMKRFISILMVLCLCSAAIFADTDGDEYDDGYIYEQNGAGDQFLKIDLLGNFPVNFDNQLYTGGGITLGYYRFISKSMALGGSALVSYNVTIGSKPLVTIPITFDFLYQPTIGKIEIPLTVGIGIYTSTCQGLTYFPGLAIKASANAYYRFTETWSAGIVSSFQFLPQWLENSSKNKNGMFATAGLGMRYHF